MAGASVQVGGCARSRPGATRRPRLSMALGLAVFAAVSWACSAFEDPTPRNLSLAMRGDAGKQVRVIYSKQFITALTETGVTQVQVLRSDTVVHTLPFDTIVDISVERRWFGQAETIGGDTLEVRVLVNVDDRSLVDETGGVFPAVPWRFAYAFNQRLSRSLDVEL